MPRIEHLDYFPSDPTKCPCDDCVEKTESAHLAAMQEVWPLRVPYALRSVRPGVTKGVAPGSLPPCVSCAGRPKQEACVEITFYVYAPLTSNDIIPFHHTRKATIHDECARDLINHEDIASIVPQGKYHKHVLRLANTERTFIPRLARLVK